MVLDLHPFARSLVGDPKCPLFVTEGVKKGDALVSRGCCAASLLGVWNWRGTNQQGGKTALAEWEDMALNGRQVYTVFDSDVMTKPEVHSALARLKAFLEHRGAKVALIYLPSGEGVGKQGVDDYLASGHSLNDLLALATTDLRAPTRAEDHAPIPYHTTPHGLVWEKQTHNGSIEVQLTNFTATIIGDVGEDDGAEIRRYFEIDASLNGRSHAIKVPAHQFGGMNWVAEHLGAGAIVYPGFGLKDHACGAIQLLSGGISEKRIYTHTGWRMIQGSWVYFHAGGAIGPAEELPDIDVHLPGSLSTFVLPEPPSGEELIKAIHASLSFLEVAPDVVTLPLYAAIWRSPLAAADFSEHLTGSTGEGKSELVALCQQHYGPALDSRNLPGSWSSTENALEDLAFLAKDTLLVIDDFAPSGSQGDKKGGIRKQIG